MNISEFIEQQVSEIVVEWVDFAHTRVPPSHDLSFEELADHARVLLLAIAADIAQEQDPEARHQKSLGKVPGNAPDVTRLAQDHAQQRFAQGFTLNHLISEFRALRASVIRRWTKSLGTASDDTFDELIRFGESIDQALTESTSLYAKKVEDSRNLLLGVLGHDLRSPLGVVHMSAEYLLRADTLEGPPLKAVARILTSAERMKAMVNDILDFTQTSLGLQLPVMPGPANIGDLAISIAGEISTVRPDCKIDVIAEGVLTGNWDSTRIGQMLTNLVSNAVQHGEPAKPVTVRVTGEADEVQVQVQNEGARIPAEVLSLLFSPLRHTSNAQADRFSGSSGLGLGLYIAREIALAHGGSIDVSSGEQGTTFSVRLPRTPPPRRPG